MSYIAVKHPILFENLRNLRSVIAQAESIPHFQVFTQHTLYELSELLPLTNRQLKTIHGMGKIRVQKYGDEILACINEYADENNVIIDETIGGTYGTPLFNISEADQLDDGLG